MLKSAKLCGISGGGVREHRAQQLDAQSHQGHEARHWDVPPAVRGGGPAIAAGCAVHVVVARRHNGRGHCVRKGVLSIALCDSRVRKAAAVGDVIIILTAKPSSRMQLLLFRAAVRG